MPFFLSHKILPHLLPEILYNGRFIKAPGAMFFGAWFRTTSPLQSLLAMYGHNDGCWAYRSSLQLDGTWGVCWANSDGISSTRLSSKTFPAAHLGAAFENDLYFAGNVFYSFTTWIEQPRATRCLFFDATNLEGSPTASQQGCSRPDKAHFVARTMGYIQPTI